MSQPGLATSILGMSGQGHWGKIQEEWLKSFKETQGRSLVEKYIFQRLANRNHKRILFRLDALRTLLQPIYPFIDREVFMAYLSIPLRYLKYQKAHCKAVTIRYPKFGRIPATGYSIPMALESSLGLFLRAARKIKGRFTCLDPGHKPIDASSHLEPYQSYYGIIVSSGLFDNDFLERLYQRFTLDNRLFYKMIALSIIWARLTNKPLTEIPKPIYCGSECALSSSKFPEEVTHK